MANKQRGEVELKGVDGTVYALKMGTAAVCDLEAKLDRSMSSLFGDLLQGGVRMQTVREFVKASHLPAPIDDVQAAALIDDVGLVPVLDGLKASIGAVFNHEESTPDVTANPPKPVRRKGAKGGVGKSSLSSPSASAGSALTN